MTHVEPDQVITAASLAIQSPADWGLGRSSHELTGPWDEYVYDEAVLNGCDDLTAYVFDTGVQLNHTEFEGRARAGFSADYTVVEGDECGHGTHVSGTVAGKTYGVMKTAQIVDVQVMSAAYCSGSVSGIIAGLNWTLADAKARGKIGRSVVNMSIGSQLSGTLLAAVAGAVAEGLTVVVSAGNSNLDACNEAPAAAPEVITVGASNATDSKWSASNWGTCVDVFAPGQDITSAGIGDVSKAAVDSGTSMASPHVAGLVLYSKCLSGRDTTPAEDKKWLVDGALEDILSNTGTGSPNLLVNNRNGVKY